MSKFLVIIVQIAFYVASLIASHYFDFCIAMVALCFYLLGTTTTIVNFEVFKPRK